MNHTHSDYVGRWNARVLGQALPPSAHAVSVALPEWRDVVGYEEKEKRVMDKLKTGYPRFVIHPLVQELGDRMGAGRGCLPFPSARAAALAADFVRRNREDAEVVRADGLHGVAAAGRGNVLLHTFWQHTGLIVSSREAEARLARRPEPPGADETRRSLRRQLAELYGWAEQDVFLQPTGMAAAFAALEAVQRLYPGRPTAQLGFPYVDTLKLQQRLGQGGLLLARLDDVAVRLTHLLDRERVAACFCEIPGNPLLGCADLRKVSPILRAHRIPLVADDVVATPANVDLGDHADLIATSLTKFIVGTGDVMGGALICNPRSPLYQTLKPIVRAQHEELLWGEDAVVLDQQARTFPERMVRHNAAGLLIAERLKAHRAIDHVWYPKWEFSEAYDAVRRPNGGWGALVTFLPKNPQVQSPAIYDRLPFCKGPSLGTVFTLACPFTLLAHYTELEWAESCGVPRHLIRLSVGLEDPEEIWSGLSRALE